MHAACSGSAYMHVACSGGGLMLVPPAACVYACGMLWQRRGGASAGGACIYACGMLWQRQQLSSQPSIRQHTSACVSIRQHAVLAAAEQPTQHTQAPPRGGMHICMRHALAAPRGGLMLVPP
jgi:hypothetical protein